MCKAAHELVESIGAHDPLTSSQYLALYQVCCTESFLTKRNSLMLPITGDLHQIFP